MKTNRNEEYTSGDHAVLCCRCELTALVKIGIKIQILCLNNTSNELFVWMYSQPRFPGNQRLWLVHITFILKLDYWRN